MLLTSCISQPRVQNTFIPGKKLFRNSEPSLSKRFTLFAEISVEYVDFQDWERYTRSLGVKRGIAAFNSIEMSHIIYKITVRNSSPNEITVGQPTLVAGLDKSYTALDSEELITEYSDPVYGIHDPENLFMFRRLHMPATTLRKVNPKTDLSAYAFDYIIPGDTILFFAVFPPLAPSIDKVIVKIPLNYQGREKIVDFEFIRKKTRYNSND